MMGPESPPLLPRPPSWWRRGKGCAPEPGSRGEENRRVWVATSNDEGKTFALETPAWLEPTGVCPCCSTRALADHKGIVYLLYRSATAGVNRDIYLLSSEDRGKSFQESLVHKWQVPG